MQSSPRLASRMSWIVKGENVKELETHFCFCVSAADWPLVVLSSPQVPSVLPQTVPGVRISPCISTACRMSWGTTQGFVCNRVMRKAKKHARRTLSAVQEKSNKSDWMGPKGTLCTWIQGMKKKAASPCTSLLKKKEEEKKRSAESFYIFVLLSDTNAREASLDHKCCPSPMSCYMLLAQLHM